MVKKETISEFMLNEHGIIMGLLNDFKKNANAKDANKYFKTLKAKQEKHVLAEEKAILIITQNGKELKLVILQILKQHEELHEIMKNVEAKLLKNTDHYEENIATLLALMKKHIALENSEFYPVLDKELDEKQKKLIMSTFREIIVGNIAI